MVSALMENIVDDIHWRSEIPDAKTGRLRIIVARASRRDKQARGPAFSDHPKPD
jgi:hypothetical protein